MNKDIIKGMELSLEEQEEILEQKKIEFAISIIRQMHEVIENSYEEECEVLLTASLDLKKHYIVFDNPFYEKYKKDNFLLRLIKAVKQDIYYYNIDVIDREEYNKIREGEKSEN